MSPVAIVSLSEHGERDFKAVAASTLPTPPVTAAADGTSIPSLDKSGSFPTSALTFDTPARRPSPWHDLAHSLSTTSLPHRRSSASLSHTPSYSGPTTASIPTPTSAIPTDHNATSPPLSTSQALRDWELRLAHPTSPFSRQTLIPPPSASPSLHSPSPDLFPHLIPKLVPESDKEGYIEYKLKLINPSAERFERLVTQMMWRLKQGRNEAIYELGLADDGTVIGLSRSDMDASLHTLELMASEVGATVLVLKEIVLADPVYPSSSFTSAESWTARDDSPAGWVVPRPKARILNSLASNALASKQSSSVGSKQSGRPSATAKAYDGSIASLGEEAGIDGEDPKARKKRLKKIKKKRSWKRRERRTAWANGEFDMFGEPTNKEKQIVFDTASLDLSSDDSTDDDCAEGRRGWKQDANGSVRSAMELAEDEDVPPFHLDLEDDVTATSMCKPGGRLSSPSTTFASTSQHQYDRRPSESDPILLESQRRQRSASSAKVRKSMERREARRLDLLRGDGMSPSSLEVSQDTGAAAVPLHAPARPSSLRLATPAPEYPSGSMLTEHARNERMVGNDSNTMTGGTEEAEEDGSFLQDLLALPLDSLSLSFADVRTITPSSPSLSASSSSTEYAPTTKEEEDYVETGRERICVEALVVRKVAHEEEEWGWGGDDDAWGLSGDGDGEDDRGPDLSGLQYSTISIGNGYKAEADESAIPQAADGGGSQGREEDEDPWGFS